MAARNTARAKKRAPARRTEEAGPFAEIRNPRARAFLAAFATCASLTRAAAAVPCHVSMHYVWKKDPAYADAFKLAEEIAGDVLEDEAVRRAHEGIEEPVIYQGAMVGCWKLESGDLRPGTTQQDPPEAGAEFIPLTVNRRSDHLLRLLLEGFKGEKYATQRHQVSGKGGGPVPLAGHGVLLVPQAPEDFEEWKKKHAQPPTEGDPHE